MIGTIRYKVRLDGKWVSSTPLRAQNGTQYKVVIDRDYGHGEVQLLGGTPVMVAEGPAGVADMQQAMKNALVGLGVKFANPATPATIIDAALPAGHQIPDLPTGRYIWLRFSAEPVSDQFRLEDQGSNGVDLTYTDAFSLSAIQSGLQTIPGWENIVVAPGGASIVQDGYYIQTDTVADALLPLTVASSLMLDADGAYVDIFLEDYTTPDYVPPVDPVS